MFVFFLHPCVSTKRQFVMSCCLASSCRLYIPPPPRHSRVGPAHTTQQRNVCTLTHARMPAGCTDMEIPDGLCVLSQRLENSGVRGGDGQALAGRSKDLASHTGSEGRAEEFKMFLFTSCLCCTSS